TENAGCMRWDSAAEYAVEPAQHRRQRGGVEGFVLRRRGGGRVAAAARTRRQVFVDGLVAQLRQQIDATTFGHELGDLRFRIAEVAEMPRARRAGLDAGGLALGF